MKLSALSAEEIEALASLPPATDIDYEPDHKPKKVEPKFWEPDLNPTQRLIWDDPTPNILAYGEKYSGKSIGVEHKMVRHCYENWDALAIVITPSIRTGKFGVIHDLETLILPAWEEGIGLEWIPSKLDPNTKDRVLKMANRHGGWSTILQISIPYAEAVGSRIKGMSPSFVMADELTDCEGYEYFTLVAAQLGRRRHIQGPQQYVGTCNPKGPSNWVYQQWFERTMNHETGASDPRFRTYHVPATENLHRPEAKTYLENLLSIVSSDPIEHARLIEGKWIERPTGEALFHQYFVPSRHVVGDKASGTGLVPVGGFPCSVGYDLGQVYSSVVFLQYVATASGPIWIVFDEIVHLREKILYKNLAIEVVERMLDWNKAMNQTMVWEHITDDSAINQWRPGSGSYDAWEFEREFTKAALVHGLPEMKMRGCPKGQGSVAARIRLLQAKLHADQLLVSATCKEVQEVLTFLESDEKDAMKPKKNARGLIHTFDALTYPLLKFEVGGGNSATGGPAISAIHQIGR